jgi:hypothetical protein
MTDPDHPRSLRPHDRLTPTGRQLPDTRAQE